MAREGPPPARRVLNLIIIVAVLLVAGGVAWWQLFGHKPEVITLQGYQPPPSRAAPEITIRRPPPVLPGETPTTAPAIHIADVPLATLPPELRTKVKPPVPALETERLRLAATPPAASSADIRIRAGLEGALPLQALRLAPDHFAVQFPGRDANWFIFSVEGAKGRTVRIDLRNVNITKWRSLNPVCCSAANLNDPATYATTAAADGAAPAGTFNGPMLPDTRGQQWQFITGVWQEPGLQNTLCLVQKFDADRVWVAMRYPYTPSLFDAYVGQLRGQPLAKVIDLGPSQDGRPLRIIQVGGGTDDAEKTSPCILMYAREQGTNQDASWTAQGAIDFLVSDEPLARMMRQQCTFLFIPMLDPDGAAAGAADRIGNKFVYDGQEGPEPRAFAAFFKQWIDKDKRLDICLNLHNVESFEGPHLNCPMMEPAALRLKESRALYALMRDDLNTMGLTVAEEPGRMGTMDFRLGGYLRKFYGTLHLPLDVNCQQSRRHLSLDEQRRIGARLAAMSARFLLESPQAKSLADSIADYRQQRRQRMAKYEQVFKDRAITNALQIEWVCWEKDMEARRAPAPATQAAGN